MSNNTQLSKLSSQLSSKLNLGTDGSDLIETLKATAFKEPATDAQMAALLIVSNQYNLNPWTKEIYAFPDKKNGIIPVVGVDGWSRIINSHPQYDGMDFEVSETMVQMPEAKSKAPEWVECRIYRKDRTHAIKVTEYMAECKRGNTKPWQSHPRRMLRHKAMIQCARLAFGYGGIYDQDEAERIVEAQIDAETGEIVRKPAKQEPATLQAYPQDKFDENERAWRDLIQSGKRNADDVIKMVSSKAILSEAQIKAIKDMEIIDASFREESPPSAQYDEDNPFNE